MSEIPNEIKGRTKPIPQTDWMRIENLKLKAAFHRQQAEIEVFRHTRQAQDYEMQLEKLVFQLSKEQGVEGWQIDAEKIIWVEPEQT